MSTCGTGSHGGSFPVPGDPDLNNSTLSVFPFFNGIRVKWTYPATLDYAVAYTEIFRSTVGTTGTEVRIAKTSATFYDDLLPETDNNTYFYWIRFVSVNGTIGDLIGPISATRTPTVEQMLDILTGEITSSQLAVELNTPIGKVLGIEGDLANEIFNRSAEIASYNAAVQQATNDAAAAFNYAATVDSDYRAANLAIQGRLDTFISGVSGEYATFEQQIITAAGSGIDVTAAVQTELQAKIDDGTIATLTTVDQVVAGELAKSVLKTEVGDVFGGYGIYNDGAEVSAFFDVDKFTIGRLQKVAGEVQYDGNGDPIVDAQLGFIYDAVDNAVYMDAANITNLTTDKVVGLDATFVSANINNAAITSAMIAGGAINNTHISNGTISGSKISNSSITNSQIANSTITNAKIGSAAVDTLKIAGNAVTAVQVSEFDIDVWIYNYGATRINAATAYFNHGHSSSVTTLIRVTSLIDRHLGAAGNIGPATRWLYLRINSGSYLYPTVPLPKQNPTSFTFEVVVSLPSGSNRIDLYSSRHNPDGSLGTSGGEWQVQQTMITFQAVKR